MDPEKLRVELPAVCVFRFVGGSLHNRLIYCRPHGFVTAAGENYALTCMRSAHGAPFWEYWRSDIPLDCDPTRAFDDAPPEAWDQDAFAGFVGRLAPIARPWMMHHLLRLIPLAKAALLKPRRDP
jgi:hypothetical protein